MNTINNFPQNLKSIMDYIVNNLHRINETGGASYSANDFGYSGYIYTNADFFANKFKIRVSDHPLEGNRILTEVQLNTLESAENWIESLEKRYFSDRFIIEEYQTIINEGTKNEKTVIAKKYTRK